MYLLRLADDTNFLAAYDSVSGAFDDGGRWVVTVDTAALSDGEEIASFATVSSWILCYEPPPKRPPQRGRHLGALPLERAQPTRTTGSKPVRRRRG
jgi:hypothetical protein